METQTKKATVTKTKFTKPYTNDKGTIYYHDIEFDNGDKGSYGSKSEVQDKFVVGKLTDYEWIKDDKNYIKIKPVSTFNKGGGNFLGSEKGQNARAALNTAALLIVGGKAPIDNETNKEMSLSKLANNLLDWLTKKSAVIILATAIGLSSCGGATNELKCYKSVEAEFPKNRGIEQMRSFTFIVIDSTGSVYEARCLSYSGPEVTNKRLVYKAPTCK